ncbi:MULTISPECIES: YchJ family protein [unclassified Acinetobacter]|uniref:YchJ family protein n=1 Tax=unclassified Acinetobacter TaxID=196816 RepID=UPI0035BAAA75
MLPTATIDNQTSVLENIDYASCCQSFHTQHSTPQTAEQLMRSRYSAYVMGLIDYIVATTAPAQQQYLDKDAMSQWSKETDWQGLQVIRHIVQDKIHSTVEFKAYFINDDELQAHHELSGFVKVDDKWYFLDPTTPCNLTMKQACLCGSGKKFKACCAKYLING